MKLSASASPQSVAKAACVEHAAQPSGLERIVYEEASLLLAHLVRTPDQAEYRLYNAALFRLAATNRALRELVYAFFRRTVAARLDRAYADLQAAWSTCAHVVVDGHWNHDAFAWPASVPRPTSVLYSHHDYTSTHPSPFTTIHMDGLFLRHWAAGRWPGGCNDAFVRRFRSENHADWKINATDALLGKVTTRRFPWRLEERHPMFHIVAFLGHDLDDVFNVLRQILHDQPIAETGPLLLLYAAFASVRDKDTYMARYFLSALVCMLRDEERHATAPNPNFIPYCRTRAQRQGCLPDSVFAGAGRGDLT